VGRVEGVREVYRGASGRLAASKKGLVRRGTKGTARFCSIKKLAPVLLVLLPVLLLLLLSPFPHDAIHDLDDTPPNRRRHLRPIHNHAFLPFSLFNFLRCRCGFDCRDPLLRVDLHSLVAGWFSLCGLWRWEPDLQCVRFSSSPLSVFTFSRPFPCVLPLPLRCRRSFRRSSNTAKSGRAC
jgi:hypothetical protein